MPRLIALALTALLMVCPAMPLRAAPHCAAFPDPDALPSKYRKLAPILSSAETGWIFTGDMLTEDYRLNKTEAKLMQAIADEFAARGITLAILMPVPRPVVAGQRAFYTTAGTQAQFAFDKAIVSFAEMVDQVAQTGIVMPNLTGVALDPMVRAGYYFKRDTHWTPQGSAMSIRALADMLKTRRPGLFPKTVGVEFTPAPLGEVLIEKGSLSAMARGVCDIEIAAEVVPLVALPRREQGLLADTSARPRVALAGSSFSDRYQRDAYRVADGLAAFLDADVENYSVSGGGAIGALEGLISSGRLRQGGFDMVVWEIPYTEGFKLSALRQVLGALQADHVDADATLDIAVQDDGVSIDAVAMGAPPRLISLVDVAPAIQKIAVRLHFSDRKPRTYKLVRKARIPSDLRKGAWSVSLSDLPKGRLQRIEITTDAPVAGTRARVW